MRMPPLLADLIHARGCKLKCEKFLTLPAHMAAFYSLLCKAIKKQPAGRSGRLFWRSGRDSNPRAIARKLISSFMG